MKVGDLVKIDYSADFGAYWQRFNGTLAVVVRDDVRVEGEGYVFVVSQCGVEEIHTCYLEVINECR